MSETMNTNLCVECKDTEQAIWIETPWNKKGDGSHAEERLCERCFDHLSVNGGGKVVKGSQWAGEPDVVV